MLEITNDGELQRLRDERDHLRIKLSLANDRRPDELEELVELERSIDEVEHAIQRRQDQLTASMRTTKSARSDGRGLGVQGDHTG